MALAAEPDPLPVVDAGRHLDRERALLDDAAGTVARLARVLDHAPAAAAAAARLGAHELAEDRVRDLLEPAAAAAGGAGDGLGARLRAGALARRAGDGDLERHLARDPARGLDQLELDLRRDIRAAGGAALPTREAEEVVAEERGEEVAERAEVEARRREPPAA